MAKSQSHIPTRQISVPAIHFDPELPITERLPDIRTAITANPIVIICGETGSGKSTQLPKLLLEMGFGRRALIGHTQPRRIAARSVAARIAEELNSPLGELVGYKIRFADQTGALTSIKLMTDGILLAELQQDRTLEQYDAIILDEAHERSLNIDLLMGILKRLITSRKELRVVITSATIDADRISQHFLHNNQPAPIIEVSGRTYPVEMRYRPLLTAEDDDESNRDIFDGICEAVDELSGIDRGDILIFLATEQDIRLATKRLRGMTLQGRLPNTEILPLYSRLSTADQNRIFNPGSQRRLILSTNVAESSLTVPRIKYVIDTGTARTSRYSPRSKVQRLPIEPISQASANQRAGRCGRLGPGICIRLFDEADLLSRDKFNTPEIRRTNLASVILQTKIMRLGELDQIPFLDPPRVESIRAGYKTLFEIGAVDDRRQVTDLGKRLGRLPIDPRLGRMIFAADEEGCLADVLIIAAALEIRDPRERPVEKRETADAQHVKFRDAESDFVSLLKLWDFFHELKQSLSQSRLRKACLQNFLSFNRMREWQDIQRQLRQITGEIGIRVGGRSNDYGKIHRALLAGLLSGVAMKGDAFEFTGAGGGKFFVWPGSCLFGKPPKWIVASEMVETERQYLRNVAKIDPAWIERLAEHLVKRNYSDPHFSKKQAACLAYERVTLYGLPVVPRRTVNYGRIDPVVAREIFIEQGLVEGGYAPERGLIAENNRLIESISSLAKKTRDRSLIFEPALVYQFYDQRLPDEVVDGAALEKHLKHSPAAEKDRLRLDMKDLIRAAEFPDVERQFPEEIDVGALRVPLDYRFEPGSQGDGITFRIPAAALRNLNPRQLDWLVPGMLEQKLMALIRSLPKALRRNLVPAPETARQVASEIEFGKGIFLEVVALHLSRLAGQTIQSSDFKVDKLDEHLLANIEVQDDQGQTVCAGRDLAALRMKIDVRPDTMAQRIENERWNRTGIKNWDFDELPESIDISSHPVSVRAFPALLDRGTHVDLTLLDSAGMARRATVRGVTRLFAMAAKKLVKSQVNWLPDLDQMQVWASGSMRPDELPGQLADLIARRAFLDEAGIPRTRSEFERRLARAAELTSLATQDVARLCPELFRRYHEVRLLLEQLRQDRWSEMLDDVRLQMAFLTQQGFLLETPWRWLAEFPRFFRAVLLRADKLPQRGFQDDRGMAIEIDEFRARYEQRKLQNECLGVFDDELELFRWMLEEYRVSCFAQTLGTSLGVSTKRLEKQWEKALRSIAGQ